MLDARHLAAADLGSQLRELVAAARHGRTDRPVHHVHIDPPPGSDAGSVMKKFVTLYEQEFNLGEVQKCGVEHIKAGRPHYHIVYSLVQPNGKVTDLRHEYARREKVSRVTEFECGLPFVKGKHNRAVAQALRKDGRDDVASAMEAAGLLDGRRSIALQTPRERAQADRTDMPIADVRASALAAWRTSDSGPAFETSLAERGLRLAEGDRGPVLIDHAGGAHSLTRSLSAAARQEGDRITSATVRRRLADYPVSTIEEAKEHVRRAAIEPRQADLPGSQKRARDEPATSPPPDPSRGTGREREPGRDQSTAEHDRRDPRSALSGAGRDQEQPRTRWGESDRVATQRLGSLDLAPLRAQADSIRLAPARQAVRDRAAAQALARIDIRDASEAAHQIAAGSHAPHSHQISKGETTMKGIRGFKSIRPRHRQDFKSKLLSDAVPDFDTTAWTHDLHQINRGPRTRIQTRDRGWVEIDHKAGIVKTWGRPGRAVELAEAIAESQGWHLESLRPTGDMRTLPDRAPSPYAPADIETWWRERGYDAVAAQDGVWIDAGSARLQDIGDQVRLHGALTPEAARALVIKASEAWGGDAELSGAWSQTDKDALWLEAQRSGVRLGACEPSTKAQAIWDSETAEAARRADTLGLVRSATGPARLLLDAAAGDVSALAKLDPDLRAFVGQYLDDDQRAELGNAEVADIMTEMARFRELGAEERARTERDRDLKPAKVRDPLDMSPPPAPAPGL
uniref:MobA/VirD2-like nuclease domain-containing protein n=1 Tax=Bosea sp. NBC_00436 TaxID=2969620 RepID=A0A9E8CQC9_9HYPH